ncbi:hypothetical protein [Candidatus Enterovibrio escicola]|uniref:Mobile element protein n=1 Tax=Candidatus Enterovibrio escicola TaxID=1927127 RepID=A0A2A5T027_9GAMM|nr:hypothetical protein [Candidatus Enterovibrio escacola]PCS21514.1 hypothetical protein BTN49_3054 [Candidatus Enterovibrio escacola]
MYRYKKLLFHKLTLRDYNAQVVKILAKAKNTVIKLDIPVRQQTN